MPGEVGQMDQAGPCKSQFILSTVGSPCMISSRRVRAFCSAERVGSEAGLSGFQSYGTKPA